MSRSAERRVAARFVAVAVLGLTGVALVPAGTAAAAGRTVAAVRTITGPVGDVTAPVLDIVRRTQTLDRSVDDQQRGNTTRITLASDVLFAFDQDALTPAATNRLAQTAALIRSRSAATGTVIRIDGYTDAVGEAAYNVGLSTRRAAAVRTALARVLGPGFTFAVAGHGAADPIAANSKPDGADNPAGRALNRRVTVAFTT